MYFIIFSFFRFLCARGRLLDPAVDGNPLLLAEADNLETLVLDGLLVGADANVSVVHCYVSLYYLSAQRIDKDSKKNTRQKIERFPGG